jgi:hypothetical protein
MASMSAKDFGIRVRVEKDLREAFVEACRAQGLGASGVLRDFMHAYAERHQNGLQLNLFLNGSEIRENPIAALVDHLPAENDEMDGKER